MNFICCNNEMFAILQAQKSLISYSDLPRPMRSFTVQDRGSEIWVREKSCLTKDKKIKLILSKFIGIFID